MKKLDKKGKAMFDFLVLILAVVGIGIGIPTFTSALEKSRQKTDLANVRALKSLAAADYMSEGDVLKGKTGQVDCYLLESGAEFTTDSTDNIIYITARWDGEPYGKGDAITLKIDCGDGKISDTVPELTDTY